VKISCPACAAKYSIADEKVQDRLAKIRCRKCGTTIVIDGKVQPVNIYAADSSMPAHADPSAEGGGGGEYSVDLGDNDQRTMSLHDLMEAYNAGTVTAETYLWTEGMADWKPLSEFPEVVEALHQAASHPAVPAAAPAAGSPWDGGAAPKAAAPSPARAASRETRRTGSADLFGSLETAGSESDSFGASHDGPVPVATGARNESSVLFSLSALTSAAAKPAPAPSASKPTASAAAASSASAASSGMKEDSGLIDLKALTAAAKPEAEAPMIAPAPLGLGAPLGFSPPPLGAGVSAQIEAPLMPPPKNRTGLFIGAGIAVAVIGAALILRPSEAPPEQTQPTVAAPAPTPTPTPTPTEATLAKPPATGTADEADAGKPKAVASKRGYRKSSGSKSTSTSGGSTPSGGGEEAAKPAPKKTGGGGGCGCAADDLMCNMRCSSGKK
jgi:predicted Zn finger-like uncharacterized protein